VAYGGGAMVFAFDQPSTPQLDARLLAWRADSDGTLPWGPAPKVLCSTLSSKDDLVVGVDAAGIAVAVWEDERADAGDVYAQNVHADGSLGLVSSCTFAGHCVGAPNSVGAGARMGASGGASVGLANLVLEASAAPPGQIGVFVMGTQQAQVPFGDGFLCVGGTVLRLLPASFVGPSGLATHALDYDAFPADQIAPGSTWNFQFWYRDPPGPLGSGFNLSDALSVSFCP
jgi:hypothetical protein